MSAIGGKADMASAAQNVRTSIHPLLLHLDLLGFEPNWRRPKPWEDGYVRRRDFIKVIAASAAAWPLVTQAQQPPTPVIGFLRATKAEESGHLVAAVREGLREFRL